MTETPNPARDARDGPAAAGWGKDTGSLGSHVHSTRVPARSRRFFVAGIWFLLWLPTVSAAEARSALLLLLREPPGLATALRAAKDGHADRAARRAALTALRRRAYAETAPLLTAGLAPLLTPHGAYEIEALPALYGLLLHVPLARAAVVAQRLRQPETARALGLASVSLHPGVAGAPVALTSSAAPGDAIPPAASVAGGEGLALAIFDRGVDPAHPWLRGAFATFVPGPAVPVSTTPPALLRSHGTAMLGIYAQVARGQPLRALGVDVLAAGPPFRFAAALAATAGPETGAGRTALARNLAWLADTDGPVPDILNYSQGNGPLCVGDPACADESWHGVTRLLDRLAEELDVLIVKSAGNAGYAPQGSLTVPADTFNGLVVGNMFAFDWRSCRPSAERDAHRIYRTSSVAPPAGVAPRLLDLVAPGVRIATAGVDPAYCRRVCGSPRGPACGFCPRLGRARAPQPGFYKDNTGTSPAAAVVGAVAARLLQAMPRDPLRARAVLINSASTWHSHDLPHPTVPEAGRCNPPSKNDEHTPWPYGSRYDRTYGWGYLDAAAAAAQAPFARRGAVAAGETRCYRTTLAPWDKVTLVWQRRVGTCTGCGEGGWFRLSPLSLALRAPAQGFVVLDRDRQAGPSDPVQQVSNGRGPAAAPRRREVLVTVSLPAGALDGAAVEPYALAAPAPLIRLAACPQGLDAAASAPATKFTDGRAHGARLP